MKNKTKILLAVCLTSTFSSMSLAEAEPQSAISGNISIANNYVWRGLAQHFDKKGDNTQKATIQGQIEYDFANGFKAGVWGTNISDDEDDDRDSSEFNFSASYAAEVDNIGYEIGITAYTFPSVSEANFEEIYIDASYADFGLTYYNSLDEDEIPYYVEASYGVNIEDIDILASVGNFGGNYNYKVYGIEISKVYEGLDYSLKFTKVSASDDSTTEKQNNTVFSISKSF